MRILLVGEHALLLEGMRKLLEDELAAEVRTVRQLVDVCATIARWEPAIAVLETTQPGSIQQLTSLLASLEREIPVLVIAPGDREQFLAALHAGARGFVGRDVSVGDLLGTIQAVQRGEWGIPRSHVGDLVDAYLLLVRERARPLQALLSVREQQVLMLLAGGMNAGRIGEQLFVSPSTVRGEIRSIVRKLGVENRTQAVAEAHKRGLLLPKDA